MLSASLWQSSIEKLSQICCNLARKSATVLCGFSLNSFFILCHTVSIMLTSGLLHGQSRTVILLLRNHVWVDFAVWQDAPSCWKMKLSSAFNLAMLGSRLLVRMAWYFPAFTVPWMNSIIPKPLEDMHPQTIRLLANFTVRFRQSGWNASCFDLITRLRLSPTATSNFDSSLNMILLQSSLVQDFLSFAHASRFFFCFSVKRGFSFA